MRKRLLYLALMVIGCAAFAFAQSHPLPYYNPCDDLSTISRTGSGTAYGSRGWTKQYQGVDNFFRTYNWNASYDFTGAVFFGPFDFEAGKIYCIKANMRKNYNGDPKYDGSVKFSLLPSGTIQPNTSTYNSNPTNSACVIKDENVFYTIENLDNIQFEEYPVFFSPKENQNGAWIGISCYFGKVSTQYFYITDFTLEESNADVPAAPTNCWVTADVEGYKKADFGFTAPTKTALGADITKGISSVDVYWGDFMIHSEKNPTPGQSYTFSHEFAMSGVYNFKFVATYDGANGLGTTVSETIGVIPPAHTTTNDYNDGFGTRHTLLANYIPSLGGVRLALDYKEKNNYPAADGYKWKIVRQPGNVVIAEASETPDIVDETFNPETKIIAYYEVTTVIPEGVSKSPKTYTSTVISLNNSVPYQVRFSDASAINEFTAYSENGATSFWTSNSNGYANANNVKLMLTTPSVLLEAGKYYSFEAGICSNTITPIGFEIYYGGANVPDSMIHEIMPYTMETSRQVRVGHKAFFSPEKSGNYSFGVRSVNWDNLSNYNGMQLFDIGVYEVNPDLPGPVEGLQVVYLSGTQAQLKFKASPKNIANQPQQSLESIVIYKDGAAVQTIENPTPGQEYTIDIPVVQGETNIYRVTPFNQYGEGTSESAKVALIVITTRADSEYINNFNTALAFDGYTVIDGGNDGYDWHFQAGEARAYPGRTNMDEWLITPPVLLNAKQWHKVMFTTHCAKAKDADKQTYISLWIGDSPDPASMKKVLIEPWNVTTGDAVLLKNYFDVDSTGTYYLGFHAECAHGDGHEVYMSNFHIYPDMDPQVPGACAIKVTPDRDGKLACKVHIDLPEQCIDGSDLQNLTYCYLYVDNETSARFSQSIRLDQFTSFDFKLPGNELSEGPHLFRAYCRNNKGDGREIEDVAFIGINAPSHPTECWAEQTENDGEVKISWEAPVIDKDGFDLNPDLVWYNVFEYVLNAQGSAYVEVPLCDSIRDLSYTCQVMTPMTGQAFKRFGVRAHTKTAADRQMSAGVIINPTLVGSPYGLPYDESFKVTTEHVYMSQRIGDVTTAMWGTVNSDPAGNAGADGDHGMAMMETLGAYCAAGLVSGRIMLNAEHPWMYLYVYNMGNPNRADMNELELQVKTEGGEWTSIYNNTIDEWTDGYNGWQKITFDLGEYAGQTIQTAIVGASVNYAYVYIDHCYIGEAPAADMSVAALEVPEEVFPGLSNSVYASVKNNGNAATTGVANLYRGNEVVGTADYTLEPGQRAQLALVDSIALDDAKMANDFDYKVVLVADKDLDLVDNTSAVLNSLVPDWTAYPTVLNLTATSNEKQNITLAWEAPAVPETASAVTYDMEEFGQPWTNLAKIGQMINLDLDNEPVAAMNVTGWPLTEYGHYGWFVADMSIDAFANYGEYFNAHSGDKTLMAMITHPNSEYQANDVLILPRLSGEAQTISFWARSFTDDYRNSFSIIVSYTDNDYYSFSEFEDHGWYAPGQWHEFKFEIPEGVQFVGIRHYGYAGAYLLVDDITFTPAGLEQLKVEGYNVTRNNEMLANAWAQAEYVDNLDADGSYTYEVSVVYNRGLSAPVMASADFTGLEGLNAGKPAVYGQTGEIAIANAAGLAVNVYNAAGMLLTTTEGAASMTIPATAGVYVVTIADATFKVTVK